MTCTAIKVEKQGFDKSVATGEVIDFDGKKYVIIFIGKISSYTYLKMPLIVATVVGQEIGSDNPQKNYVPRNPQRKKFKNGEDKNGNSAEIEVGTLVGDKHGIVAMITDINKIEYSFTDVIAEFDVQYIDEWTHQKMNDAVKANRISKFKVINGGMMGETIDD
ncbi:hypothetical protein [Levilactobacillus brevis]|uniref:hypothetical protein n=1 Tax=Levilactobacillus brevis TaxID=1580 RepID=UPI00207431AF|nr:hypothetical protein [Levilactobacillus brevis]